MNILWYDAEKGDFQREIEMRGDFGEATERWEDGKMRGGWG